MEFLWNLRVILVCLGWPRVVVNKSVMPKDTIIDKFGKLPLGLKLISVGSFLTFVSVFLPWYADLDTFNTGDKFIGLGGPLYLLGFLIMVMSVGALLLSGLRLLEKKLPQLPLEEAHFHIFVGAMSMFLLIITSSIYFHSKFGVNITMKEMRFGMVAAFIGTGLVLLGGLSLNKARGVSFEGEGKLDKLIDVEGDSHDRVQRDVKKESSEAVPLEVLDEGNLEKEEPIAVSVETSGGESEKPEKQNLF